MNVQGGGIPIFYAYLSWESGRVVYIWLATSIMVSCPFYVHLLWYLTVTTHLYHGIMPKS